MKEQERITKATLGQEVRMNGREPDKVKEGCSADSGYWFCVTHQKYFENNMKKDTHISDEKKHQMSWICNEHGAEVP